MAATQPVSHSTAITGLHHHWGHQGWTHLSSHAGSGGVWSLARKVGVFFLVAFGLVLLIRGCGNNRRRIIRNRDDVHRALDRVSLEREPGSSSARQVVEIGIPEEKTISLASHYFDGVELQVPATLNIVVGRPTSLTISADRKILEVLTPQMSGSKLILKQESNTSLEVRTPIRYTLSIPDLQEVVVSSTGKVMIAYLNRVNFSCMISGSAEVAITEGFVQKQFISVSGNGKYRAPALESRISQVTLSDNASAHIKTPQSSLGVDLSGNSKCYYTGAAPFFSQIHHSVNAQVLPEGR
jgi:hypothetical protein